MSRNEAQKRFEVSTIGRAVNSAPAAIINFDTDIELRLTRFRNHLKKHKLDNEDGYGKVYQELKKQLKDLNMAINGWDEEDPLHIFTLFNLRNIILLSESGRKHKIPALKLTYKTGVLSSLAYKNKEIIASTDTTYRAFLISLGIMLYLKLDKKTRAVWKEIRKTDGFIAYNATKGEVQDFAESYTAYILTPQKVGKFIPQKKKFINENVMYSLPKLKTKSHENSN